MYTYVNYRTTEFENTTGENVTQFKLRKTIISQKSTHLDMDLFCNIHPIVWNVFNKDSTKENLPKESAFFGCLMMFVTVFLTGALVGNEGNDPK